MQTVKKKKKKNLTNKTKNLTHTQEMQTIKTNNKPTQDTGNADGKNKQKTKNPHAGNADGKT